jgi:hypothetical protein
VAVEEVNIPDQGRYQEVLKFRLHCASLGLTQSSSCPVCQKDKGRPEHHEAEELAIKYKNGTLEKFILS